MSLLPDDDMKVRAAENLLAPPPPRMSSDARDLSSSSLSFGRDIDVGGGTSRTEGQCVALPETRLELADWIGSQAEENGDGGVGDVDDGGGGRRGEEEVGFCDERR